MNKMYEKGKRFEDKVREKLEGQGLAVVRAGGSKGKSKADLVAFHPAGLVYLIQCKTDGKISKAEWDRIYQVALWSESSRALVAQNGEKRGSIEYLWIQGERIPYARRQPAIVYQIPLITAA